MQKQVLGPEQRRFIDEVASLLAPWGMPQTTARLYGYLLLGAAPASLDRIAAELEVGKSSVSVAARQLEKYMLVRRHGERGTKRVFYSVSENYAGLFAERSVLLGQLGRLLQGSAAKVATGATSRRLKLMSDFYLSMRDVMEGSIRKFGPRAPTRKSG